MATAQARRAKRVDALGAEKLAAAATLVFAVWGLWDWLDKLGQPLAAIGGFSPERFRILR